MAFHPQTGLVYLPMNNNSYYYERAPVVYQRGQWNTGVGSSSRPEPPEITHPLTSLKAWDPVRNAEVWRYPASGADGGALTTGGNLVFWGIGDRFIALNARTGAELWSADIGNAPATPVTFEIDGRQYVTIMAGRTRQAPARVWTFMLPN
jgi:outer membrane protein assembly factor BamB